MQAAIGDSKEHVLIASSISFSPEFCCRCTYLKLCVLRGGPHIPLIIIVHWLFFGSAGRVMTDNLKDIIK